MNRQQSKRNCASLFIAIAVLSIAFGPVAASAQGVSANARQKVPVALKLELRTNIVINGPSHWQKTYSGPGESAPAIWLTATFSDGSTVRSRYHVQFNRNVVFDDESGDPNDLINVQYWNVGDNEDSSFDPGPGRSASRLIAPKSKTGKAILKVSLRDAPGVTASIPVTVVGAPSIISQGRGEFNDAAARFHVYGFNGTTSIRIYSLGREYNFRVDTKSYDLDGLTGRLTPCSGGECLCSMFEEGQDFYMASCTAPSQNNGASFSFRLFKWLEQVP